MSSLAPSQPRRHFLAFLLSIGCWVLIIVSYQRDDHYWLYLGVAIQALLLLHVCLRSRYLTGLGVAAVGFFFIGVYPALQTYIWPSYSKRALNLRNITQAFIKYAEQHGHLPRAAIVDQQNRPLLSWRVEILPLLGQEALYQQFKLDEPWNSEHNIKLLPLIPQIYQPVNQRVPLGYTHIVVLRGPGSLFEEPTPPSLGRLFVADGASMTVLLAEAGKLVPWTKPEDEIVDPELPAPWLRAYPSPSSNSYSCLAFLDGRVVNLYDQYSHKTNRLVKIDARKLHAYVTWKGGEVMKAVDDPIDLEGP